MVADYPSQDYAELLAAGANLTGKIVIVRYGSLYRGLKVRLVSFTGPPNNLPVDQGS